MMKRVLASVLSLLLILSLFSTSVFANPYGYSSSTARETSEWITADEMTVLYKLGVSPWKSIASMGNRVDEVVTRAVMAWHAAKFVPGGKTAPEGFETLFKDVTSEHEEYKYIKAVYNAGFMNGYPDGTFHPDDLVTTEQAAIVLLRALGYGPYIEVAGVNKALITTKILDGIPMTDKLTHPMIFRMMLNTLESPAVLQGNYGVSEDSPIVNVEYTINEDYLGFEHLYGVRHVRGRLEAVGNLTLSGIDNRLRDSYIVVDGVTYNYPEEVYIGDLLGYNVELYYRKATDNNLPEVFHLFKSEKNEELVLTHDEIVSFARGVYKYSLDGYAIKEIVLNNKTKVIYNGVANPGYDDADMTPAFGTVTFIDNDNVAGYEIVKVENYDFYYVSDVNAKDFKVFDRESSTTRVLALKDVDELKVYVDGVESSFEAIIKGKALAVRRSGAGSGYDKVMIDLVYSDVFNVVKSVTDETIKTEAKEFKKWSGLTGVTIGMSYDLYEFMGQIVMVKENAGRGVQYGYLLDLESEGTFGTTIKVAYINLTTAETVYTEMARRVNLDGTSRNTTTEAATIENLLATSAQLSAGYSASYPFAQPIKYLTNASGQISSIDTANYVSGSEDATSMQVFDTTGLSPTWYKVVHSFANGGGNSPELIACVGSETATFQLSNDEKMEEKYYSTSLNISDGGGAVVDVLDKDANSNIAGCVIYYEQGASSSLNVKREERAVIVADMREVIDENENVVVEIDVYQDDFQGHHLFTYRGKHEVFANVEVGDMIYAVRNSQNEVLKVYEVFDVSDPAPARNVTNPRSNRVLKNPHANETISGPPQNVAYTNVYYGTLLNIYDTFYITTPTLVDDDEGIDVNDVDVFYLGGTDVYRYTEDRGPKVEKVSLGDLVPYSMDEDNASVVIINCYSTKVKQIYIIDK